MSDEIVNVENTDVGRASARHAPDDGVRKHALPKKLVLIAIEIVLVIVIVGLLVATWLPAIIGANPDAPKGGPLP